MARKNVRDLQDKRRKNKPKSSDRDKLEVFVVVYLTIRMTVREPVDRSFFLSKTVFSRWECQSDEFEILRK